MRHDMPVDCVSHVNLPRPPWTQQRPTTHIGFRLSGICCSWRVGLIRGYCPGATPPKCENIVPICLEFVMFDNDHDFIRLNILIKHKCWMGRHVTGVVDTVAYWRGQMDLENVCNLPPICQENVHESPSTSGKHPTPIALPEHCIWKHPGVFGARWCQLSWFEWGLIGCIDTRFNR